VTSGRFDSALRALAWGAIFAALAGVTLVKLACGGG